MTKKRDMSDTQRRQLKERLVFAAGKFREMQEAKYDPDVLDRQFERTLTPSPSPRGRGEQDGGQS